MTRKIISPDYLWYEHEFWGITQGDLDGNQWMTALVNHSIKEDIKILDYGCGGGRLSNHLSHHLDNFTYYGVEPPTGAGPKAIEFAKDHFKDDRVHFDLIGSAMEAEAIDVVDLVVLGSVFTHLLFDDALAILRKFIPIFMRKGKVVASVYIGQQYEVSYGLGAKLYGHENCHGAVVYTEEQLSCLKYKLLGRYFAQERHWHEILGIEAFYRLYL